MTARHRLGPHRDPAVDRAVLEAARDLLVERGYAATSIDAIATRAGVSRPAIYRRWPSKAHLIAKAVFPDVSTDEVAPDLVSEVRTVIRGTIQLFGSAEARAAMPGLMADMRADSNLYQKLSARLDSPTRKELSGYLSSGRTSAGPVLDSNTLLDTIAGAALFAMCIRDIDDLDGFAESLEDLLLHGIAGRNADSARPGEAGPEGDDAPAAP
ncbi:helix-turn-helix domain-containing protein [Nocardia jinanensis]|uniref:TetR family transcriptional regulator n=1 Tax=Nocardia jinanensis TaxID=382504 RepID=A0A917RD98_9NOCA|nr:TetR/AcrR family transcriptional regulator [Nocardia jinanensis]GGL02527.1 TetR family transcriptional regulator [Nocardia jinanensis]